MTFYSVFYIEKRILYYVKYLGADKVRLLQKNPSLDTLYKVVDENKVLTYLLSEQYDGGFLYAYDIRHEVGIEILELPKVIVNTTEKEVILEYKNNKSLEYFVIEPNLRVIRLNNKKNKHNKKI